MAQIPTSEELDFILNEKLEKFALRIIDAIKGPDLSGRKWLKACELKKLLPLSDYRITEMRIRKLIDFQKIGGTYYYTVDSINKLLQSKLKE